jgi:hypothetical protein
MCMLGVDAIMPHNQQQPKREVNSSACTRYDVRHHGAVAADEELDGWHDN